MRIGIDAHMLGDRSGGNESYYSNILRNMKTDDANEYILFVRKGTDISAYRYQYKIVEFRSTNSIIRNLVEIPKLCRKYKLDVIHMQYFIPFHCCCPIICTIHDICFEHYKNIFTQKEYIRQRLLIPYAAKHSTYVVTDSDYSKRDIIEHYGLAKSKVVVSYAAVNSSYCKLTKEKLKENELREQFGISKSPFVLTVGNLQPRKNIRRLIEAFCQFSNQKSFDGELVIVGKKAWMYDEIISSAVKGSGKIIFTDYVDEQDLIRLYNAALFFIYPSFFEGFGLPPLEALACGTPVAVANATSLPEVVGNAGKYFDPLNVSDIVKTLEQMVYDGESCDSNLMKKQVDKFSWSKSAQIVKECYLKLGKK